MSPHEAPPLPPPPPEPIELPYATPHTALRRPWRSTAMILSVGLLLGAALMSMALHLMRARAMQQRQAAVAAAAAAVAAATPTGKGRNGPPSAVFPAPGPPPPPPTMDLSAGPTRITIAQRQSQAIPGSGGSVLVHLDDITARQVRVEVQAAVDGRSLAAANLREGDWLAFQVGDELFVLVAAEFITALIHDDRGVFVVRRLKDPPDPAEAIAALVAAVEASGAVVLGPPGGAEQPAAPFATNDADGNPRPAGAYLRDVWWFTRPRVRTAADLIRAVSEPPGPGAPPTIRLPDGTTSPAGAWLRSTLDGVETGAPRAGSVGP